MAPTHPNPLAIIITLVVKVNRVKNIVNYSIIKNSTPMASTLLTLNSHCKPFKPSAIIYIIITITFVRDIVIVDTITTYIITIGIVNCTYYYKDCLILQFITFLITFTITILKLGIVTPITNNSFTAFTLKLTQI
jgi:hypothetical protein